MGRRTVHKATKSEIEAKAAYDLKDLEYKYELKRLRCTQRWQAARTLKTPLSIAAVAVPVWMAQGFAGTTTLFSVQLSIMIAVSGLSGAGALFYWRKSRILAKDLEKARARIEAYEKAALELPGVPSPALEAADPDNLRSTDVGLKLRPEGGEA